MNSREGENNRELTLGTTDMDQNPLSSFFFDKLFTSYNFLAHLRQKDFEATDTTREIPLKSVP